MDSVPQCCRQSKLLKQLDADRKESSTTDFVVIVEKERFNVHKVVLATYSKYFKIMFTGNFLERTCRFVELKEVTKIEFSWLIDHMYGELLDLKGKSVSEIEKAIDMADMLCVDSFLDECKDQVCHWKSFNEFYVPYEIALKLSVTRISSEILTHLLKHTFLPIYRHFLSSFVRLDCVSRRLLEDFLDMIRSPNQEAREILDQSKFNVVEKLMAGPALVLKFISWTALTEKESASLLEKTLIRELPFVEVGRCLMEAKDFHIPPKDWPVSFSSDEAERYLRNAFRAVNLVHEMARNDINALNLTIGVTMVKGLTVKTTIYDGEDAQRHTLFSPCPVKQVFQNRRHLYLVGQKEIYKYNFSTKNGVLKTLPELLLTNKIEYQTVFVSKEDEETYYFLGKHIETDKVMLGIFNESNDVLKSRELDLEIHGRMYVTVRGGEVAYLMTNARCYKYDLKTYILEQITVLSAPIFGCAPLISQPLLLVGNSLYVFSKSNYCTIISLVDEKDKISRKMISKYVDAYPLCAFVTKSAVVVALSAPSFENEVQINILETDAKNFKCLGFVAFLSVFDTREDKTHLFCVDFL